MSHAFSIEDESHAEPQGEFASFADAVAELARRKNIPWDEEPNKAPCSSWKTCGRRYEIIEFDTSVDPWKEVQRTPGLTVSSGTITWLLP